MKKNTGYQSQRKWTARLSWLGDHSSRAWPKICLLFSPDTFTVFLVRQTLVDSGHAEAGQIWPLHFQELFVLWVLHDRKGIFPGDVEELVEIALDQRCLEFTAFRPLQ